MNTSKRHSGNETLHRDGDVEDTYPLSPLQHGMLFHNLLEQASGVDIEQIVCTLREKLDTDSFAKAWRRVVSRHAILRTAFEWEGLPVPRQNVHRGLDLPLENYDWCGLPPAEQKSRLTEYLRDDRSSGFDLASAPLFRIAVIQTSANSSIFVWTFHHALLDGRSYRLAIQEFFSFYDAFSEGRDPDFESPRPYKDYIEWEQAQDLGKAETFWRRQLGDLSSPTPLIVDRKAADGSRIVSERGQFEKRIPGAVTSSLRTIAAENGFTLNTVVQGAWAALLSFYCGADDVVFGVTRACRHSSLEGLDSMLGLFINTIPMRVSVDGASSVLEFFKAIRGQHVALRAYENTPLIKIQDWSGTGAGSPIFESIVVFDNAELDADMKALGGKWTNRDFRVIEQTNYPMTLFAYGESEMLLRLVYDKSRLDEESVIRMAGHLEKLLSSIAVDPGQRLSELSLLTDDERGMILGEWNETGADFTREACIHHLFETQAERTPDAVALAFEDREITYAELDRRADQLAGRLIEHGVGPDRLVGISLGRSPEMVVAMLAILKAGGAYVPLDPEYPAERLEFMVRDAAISVLLTDQAFHELSVPAGVNVINIDDFWERGDNHKSVRITSSVGPGNLAYVIYTSGSTGVPKGVMIEHRNVTNFFAAIDRVIGTDPGVWLALTSISFDISVMELLWTLTRGYKVVIQGGNAVSTYAADEDRTVKPMDFSLFYFSSDYGENTEDKYRLLLEGARFADTHQFEAVWTPERHFHSFGGLYPNPSVTSAAIAAVTQNVRIRAGSVVLPLHDPIRVAEEWAVVDNISKGRVDIAFASGWHASDFAFAPESYADRKESMRRGIETVRTLWSGEAITRTSGDQSEVEVKIFPKPVQSKIPIWLTAAGSPDTFRAAGEVGANVLTNLLGQSVEDLAEKIRIYREAWENGDHDSPAAKVTLMLHTFVGDDIDFVREKVRKPFTKYLRTSVDLIKNAPWAYPAFQADSRRKAKDLNQTLAGENVTEADLDVLAEHAFDRYFETSGLFGTPETCLDLVNRLKEIGVDEIACLVDFIVDVDSVLASLEHLDKLRELSNRSQSDHSIPAQIARHNVTHLQCTPSAARLMISDERTRASLSSLKHIALGGEALPAALVHEIAGATGATLHNMYGPTETTIWSTSSTLSGRDATVTIGRPLVNTQIYILNKDLQPVPVGIPGDLYIGGDGVARGYLNRVQLTGEKFIPSPVGGSARLYKTGDLAKYRSDGTIEFLGRGDHQVKVRGYRVEPDEIQTQLDSHPEVLQSVVHARDDASDGKALVAYVVHQKPNHENEQLERITRWSSVWNEAYGRNGSAVSTTKNFAGWNSSYTGQPIPEDEMNEWLEGTVSKILALKPSKVLEIGCGTGLLLFEIAPACSEYSATDISDQALKNVRRAIDAVDGGLPQVTLLERRADDLAGLPEGPYDTILLNSVIQYFPDQEYLLNVIRGALRMLKPGGNLFIGDVRSLALQEAFHTSVELERSADSDSCGTLIARANERRDREQELLIAPEFFASFQKEFTQIAGVEITLKKGRHSNELTKFRYDVRLKMGIGEQTAQQPNWIAYDKSFKTIEDIRAVLNDSPDDIVAIAGIPNSRLRSECSALALLTSSSDSWSVAELRKTLSDLDTPGFDPAEVWEMARSSDLSVNVRWSPAGPDLFDVVFRRGAESDTDLSEIGPSGETAKPVAYTNQPKSGHDTEITARLRTYLQEKLPPYMVPSAFVLLDELPLTPNGKLDLSALPSPESGLRDHAQIYAAPTNEIEEAVEDLWAEILGIDKIGIDKSFFHVGGHSLLATQLVSRLRTTFGTGISLREVFDFPTISGISNCLLRSEAAPGQVKKIARIMMDVKRMPESNGVASISLNGHAK